MEDPKIYLGDQSDPPAKDIAMEMGKGKNEGAVLSMLETDDREADLEDFGNFQDSETFDEFGDFGEFEGAEEPQSGESGLPVENRNPPQPPPPDSSVAEPLLTACDPLSMSPEAFSQYLEQVLSSFRLKEGEIDSRNPLEMFEAGHEQQTLDRKGDVVNYKIKNRTANLHLSKINGAVDDIGRLALERVLERLGFSGQSIHQTGEPSTAARDAAWNADLDNELDNLAVSVASAQLANKTSVGTSLASPLSKDGTDGTDGLGTFEALVHPESPTSRPVGEEPWVGIE